MEKGNWIDEENLLAFLIILSHTVSYDFDSRDWKAVQFGISETCAERNIWFEYVLPGNSDIEVKLAKEEGTALVMYRFNLPERLESIYDFLVYIIQDFRLTHFSFKTDPF